MIQPNTKIQSGDAPIKQSEIIEIIQTLPPQLTKKESEAFEHDKKILIGEGN